MLFHLLFTHTPSSAQGNDVSLDAYEGKVLLIVNTATKCELILQYRDLQDLHLKYKDKGFEILDFPCNQFGSQALGTNEEITDFCEMKYKTTFKTFSKIDVNGDNANPLYKYLKSNSNGFLGEAIKENFSLCVKDLRLFARGRLSKGKNIVAGSYSG